MPARSIASGTISFGLVSIPVRLFVATHSEQPSFNFLHGVCNSRIRQQTYCPRCERVVERSERVRGYALNETDYVRFTDEELKALEAAASSAIEIQEFVPLADVDPIYFASTHYLGPDRGGEKAYRLLAEAMRSTGKVALAQHVSRGKEHLVLLRPFGDGLALHGLYHADEIRAFSEIDRGGEIQVRPAESDLAHRLIADLSVERKVAGEDVTSVASAAEQPQVIDLMDALKRSLAEAGGSKGRRPIQSAGSSGRSTARKRATKK